MTDTIKQHLLALLGGTYPDDQVDAAIELALQLVGHLIGRPVTEEDEAILIAVAMVAANILVSSDGGPVTSETIGEYSYARAGRGSAAGGGFITPDVEDILRPWLQRAGAMCVSTPTPSWPEEARNG